MKEKSTADLLKQILANQSVIYAKIHKIQYPNKSTPDSWIQEEFEKEVEKFKNLL